LSSVVFFASKRMRGAIVLLCLLVTLVSSYSHYSMQFQGYQVIRANLTSQSQIDTIFERNMDVWSGNSWAVLGENDIMVNRADLSALRRLGVRYSVIVDDVAATIQMEQHQIAAAKSNAQASWFDTYHPLAEIAAFSAELEKTYPQLVKYTPSVGQSVEKRDVGLLKIAAGKAVVKSKLFLVGGQHAREWIGPATVLYIANKLVTGYGVDSAITELLDNYDFVIIPVANPDGYVWTWTNYRLWRKNRRVNTGGSYGVDLNRNWANHWCESGASRTPSSDTYCGTGPASEPETQAVQNASIAYGPFGGAIDFHSYGQLIMRPYGWSNTPPNNNEHLAKVGDGMRDVMIKATGTVYTNQAIWQLYLSSGSSADYLHDNAKIPLSFGFEARDTGRYGFELPASEIIPSGEENFAAVAYLASQIIA